MPDVRTVRPLLKWAGGKRQLLPELRPFYPSAFARYFEPFLGSGAVFLDLHNTGRLDGRDVYLSDINADIIGCYLAVREDVDGVIAALRAHERAYAAAGGGHYYAVRDEAFNPIRREVHASRQPAAAYTPELAAMLIFLNRTGFNGLFRLNQRGAFNVPVGRYSNPRICDGDHIRAVAAAFNAKQVTIACTPFEEVLAGAGTGDFVYCDPPYAPLSKTASFAHYNAGGFSAFDQRRLQQVVIAAARRGAHIVLSNSSAPEIVDLYSSRATRAAGLRLTLVPARRAINSRGAARGPVDEVIVSNTHARLRMAKATPRLAKTRTA